MDAYFISLFYCKYLIIVSLYTIYCMCNYRCVPCVCVCGNKPATQGFCLARSPTR